MAALTSSKRPFFSPKGGFFGIYVSDNQCGVDLLLTTCIMAQLSDLKANLFVFKGLEDSCFLRDLEVRLSDFLICASQGLSGEGQQITYFIC